jgi:NADH-quinone oxidoreductase subunit G/NADP-reducing hydrogenase subunit HndD
MEELVKGESPYHFIEIMGCPGGCITGGGQPRSADPEVRLKRLKGLYLEDEGKLLRKSHENQYIASLYKEFLQYPGSHKAHELLHTHYVRRGEYNQFTKERFVLTKKPVEKLKPSVNTMQPRSSDVSTRYRKIREQQETERIFALEAENQRVKNELQESQEMVEILKGVVSEYAFKRNSKLNLPLK